jgi:hypothetical protein
VLARAACIDDRCHLERDHHYAVFQDIFHEGDRDYPHLFEDIGAWDGIPWEETFRKVHFIVTPTDCPGGIREEMQCVHLLLELIADWLKEPAPTPIETSVKPQARPTFRLF